MLAKSYKTLTYAFFYFLLEVICSLHASWGSSVVSECKVERYLDVNCIRSF